MPNGLATKPQPTVRFYNIPVEVPPNATEDEVAEVEMRALYRAYRAAARRVGAVPRPALAVEPQVATYLPAPVPAGPPSPVSARTVPEFLDRMRELKKWAKLSYEKLEQLGGKGADGGPRLPHSTMNRLLSRSNETKLPDNDQLAAFVLACGLTEEQWREWSWVHGDIQSTGETGSTRFPALLDRLRRNSANVSNLVIGSMLNGMTINMPDVSVGKGVTIDMSHIGGAAPTITWPTNASPATVGAR